MERRILALCDPEEDYAQHMCAFLKRSRELPWEVNLYTRVEELLRRQEPVDLLLIAESAYGERVRDLEAGQTVVLGESGLAPWEGVRYIDKYQRADQVLRELLGIYAEREGELCPRLAVKHRARLIGMYSPVRRVLQTTFALTYGQLLAEGERTLYLNFEHFAGLEELAAPPGGDLSALLYFLKAEREKFLLRVQAMAGRKGKLDYIAPMNWGQNLLGITGQEWQLFLERILESGLYDAVILDLSESMQGLFDILRLCCRVYTIEGEDRLARCKMDQYEQLLALQEYGDVLEKTEKCRLPLFRRLPEQIEQYTRGELAEYVRGLIEREDRGRE